jgi:hypothetical protein
MPSLILEYPKLAVTLTAPDDIARILATNFAHAVTGTPSVVPRDAFEVQPGAAGLALVKNGAVMGLFADPYDLMFAIEEDLEFALIESLDGWIGLHAGAVVLDDIAIVTVGNPDTGKTTTTLQLVELGLPFLCEEVTPVDPATCLAHAFPHPLTLARDYGEAFDARYPVRHGALTYRGAEMARYSPRAVHRAPTRVGAIILPKYDPAATPALDEVSPSDVLPDLFHYCFTPTRGDELLYDGVIRVVEQCRLFRLRTTSIETARELLQRLVAELSAAR